MAEAQKTLPTDVDPAAFIAAIPEKPRRERGERLLALMTEETGDTPVMWGPSMIGYGTQHYRSKSGREGDWPRVAFSPRKGAMSLYGLQDHAELRPLLDRLGTFTTGVGCVYVKRFEDVDEAVLRELVRRSYELARGFGG